MVTRTSQTPTLLTVAIVCVTILVLLGASGATADTTATAVEEPEVNQTAETNQTIEANESVETNESSLASENAGNDSAENQSAETAGSLVWAYDEPDDWIRSSPTVVDGTAYVGADDGSLYAVDVEDGSNEWVFGKPEDGVSSSPAVANGTVFVAYDRALYAVDAETGQQQWTASDLSGRIRGSPAVADGTVFITSGGTLAAVSAASGDLEWTVELDDEAVRTAPTVADGIAYVGTDEGTLLAIDATTGRERWRFSDPGEDALTESTVAEGAVYVGSDDGTLYALDAETGEERWTYTEPRRLRTAPTVADGTVFVQSSVLAAVDAATGEELWTVRGEISPLASPTVAGDTVYAAAYDSVLAVDAATGDRAWTYDDGYFGESSPTVVDGTVYAGSLDDETLFAIDAGHDDSSHDSRVLLGTYGHHHDLRSTTAPPTPFARLAPVADVAANQSVTFVANESEGPIARYEWDFGDGQTETTTDSTVDHVYDEPGSYELGLRVVDAENETSEVATTVSVKPPLEWNAGLSSNGVAFHPATVNGTLYAVTEYGATLHAIDTESGDVRWTFDESDGIGRAPPAVGDGTVYVGIGWDQYGDFVDENELYAVDAATGNVSWTFTNASYGIESAPTVDGERVYVDDYGTLFALDARSGEVDWTFDAPSRDIRLVQDDASPTVADDTVYVGSDDGTLFAVDAETGEQMWRFDEPAERVARTATVATDTVYVTAEDGTLYALAAETGERLWRFEESSGQLRTSPTVASNAVYVASSETLYAINGSTGVVEWAYDVPAGTIDSTPTVAGDSVYAAAEDVLYAVSVAGEPEWTFESANGSISSSPAVVDGTLYLGTDDGTLYALDTGRDASSEDSRVALATRAHEEGQAPDGNDTDLEAALSPVANASVNETVTFDASESEGDIERYEWDFGDGTTIRTNASTVEHAYDAPGTFDVTVTVIGESNETDAATVTVSVANAEGPPPIDGTYHPTDLTGDGLYEDVDGSGYFTSNDVVVFFRHFESPAIQENAASFDFADSGDVGFDDVVALFSRSVDA